MWKMLECDDRLMMLPTQTRVKDTLKISDRIGYQPIETEESAIGNDCGRKDRVHARAKCMQRPRGLCGITVRSESSYE